MDCIFHHCSQPAHWVATFDDPDDYEGKEWPLCKFHWNDSTIQHVLENKDNVYIRKVGEES